MRTIHSFATAGALAALLSVPVFAQLPKASKPDDAGISAQRLERMRAKLKADVEAKKIPGAVVIIARNGKMAAAEAVGFQERASQKPMRADAIFRIASMSKPITTVAAMILSEEGKLDIGAPLAQYIPDFRGATVGADKAAAKRAITVQDLMRHTSGLTYGIFGNSPVDMMYRQANLFAAKSLAEQVSAIAKLPLLHQPGEFWEYSMSTDVLGRVIEVASGMDFDQFVAERITKPLKMNDTGFYLTATQAERLAKPDVANPLLNGNPTEKPAVLSGGGGMFSTAGDYARFCQMLLNGGELEGVRVLSPKTVQLMTSDQLPPNTERHTTVAMGLGAFGPTPENGTSFGLGFAVRVDAGRNPLPGSIGDFSWGGITGPLFWVDPKEKLVAVMMVQNQQANNNAFWRQTRTMVYQALVN